MSGVGFYGKLPAAGDFVRRRLPGEFVEGWDRHFQHALEAGRRALGAGWDAAWRDGPVWRFVLPAQVCGGGAWCGVIGRASCRERALGAGVEAVAVGGAQVIASYSQCIDPAVLFTRAFL
ncbi:type VI secretion system-associated protein TagF, partial [Burkholderia sp. Ac-20379]|uniref:type VI secretion system-associated protein TagF n=1 Tax=Burkholderia sp. Ac-20379 TaxID=2703900 RepID=UPI001981F952